MILKTLAFLKSRFFTVLNNFHTIVKGYEYAVGFSENRQYEIFRGSRRGGGEAIPGAVGHF